MTSRYAELGASATKEDVRAAIAGEDQGLFPGAFCNLRSDPFSGDDGACVAIHADGAGTKAIIAYLAFKEAGTVEPFRGIAQDSAVMNIDDLACIGATGPFLLSNTIGRNAHRVPGSVLAAIISGYREFARRMARVGVDVELGGGETADLGDIVSTIVVDSTVLVRMDRRDVIDLSKACVGDVIVGMSSSGKATYEDTSNSGIGSNGFASARHLLLSRHYGERYPETVSATVPESLRYRGKFKLDQRLPESDMTVGEALLSPTRTYTPILRALFARHRRAISGVVHCSGGGQAKCRSFGERLRYVKDALFEPPPVFREIHRSGLISMREMYMVFNMGHRMEVYCSPDAAADIVRISESFGVEARVVGRIEASTSSGNQVAIEHAGERFFYD